MAYGAEGERTYRQFSARVDHVSTRMERRGRRHHSRF